MLYAIRLVNTLFHVCILMVIVRAILSWFPHDRKQQPFDLLYRLTDPLILTCREILYSIFRLLNIDERQMPMDFSPLLAVGILYVVQMGIVRLLISVAH
jgi:uncharacterized protein YggT (Ycf19 family)